MDAKATGQFIAELRKQKGLTQKELAEKLQITGKAISRWETGKGLPEISLLKPLAEIWGVSIGDLLSGRIVEAAHIKEQTDQIIIDSLNYSEDEKMQKRIFAYFLAGIVVTMVGLLFTLIMGSIFNGNEALSVGIGIYLCIVNVTCTGVIVAHMEK